jgi:parallel beta-helix repeat protein
LRERSKRALLGLVVAIGLMGVVPAVAFAGIGNPSCGDTLMSNTTLTADLDCSAYAGTALYFGKHRLVLDLNGHTIWGQTGDDDWSGVDTNGFNHGVIRNGEIANFETGVWVNDSYNTRLRNLTISGEAADLDDYGVYAENHVATVVRDATISGVTTGVYLEYGANALVTGSDITAADTAIYPYNETKDTFSWNTLVGDYGVYEYQSHANRYTGNSANGGSYGFYFQCDNQGRVFLTGNTANDNTEYGFYLDECYNNSSGWAASAGSAITGNRALRNGTGYYDYYSINAVWTNNVAKWNDGDGFLMEYPGGVTMTANVSSGNGSDGFAIVYNYGEYAVENFSRNVARRNDGHGMWAEYGVPGRGNVSQFNGSTNCENVLCNE